MIELMVKDVVTSFDELNNFSQLPLKAKTAYQVARVVREVARENDLFQERRSALVEKYAKKDEDGKPVVNDEQMMSVAPENTQKFLDEMNEILNSKIELNVEKIKIEDITCEVTPRMISKLMVFINE